MLAWALIGLTQGWLHLSADTPPQWGAVLLEAILFAWVGAALHRLGDRWSWLRHPVLPIATVFLCAGWQAGPGGWAELPFAVGLLTLVLGPATALAWSSNAQIPRWAGAALVVLMVTLVHTVRAAGSELGRMDVVLQHLSRSISGPFVRSAMPAPQPGRPLILVTIDTLRADDAEAMKTLQRLKASGRAWPAAQSTASWTLPAMGSILTGQPSAVHGAGCLSAGFCQGLNPNVQTLATRLKNAGYVTVGISANPWTGRTNGFAKGFDRFHDLGTHHATGLLLFGDMLFRRQHQDAGVVVDLALRHVRRMSAERAVFLWIHLLDPHLPYPHSADPAFRVLTAQDLRTAQVMHPDRKRALRAAYRAEIAHADRHLMRLLDELDERNWLDQATIVLTSDHGEEFWEHGGVEHGHSHHREVIEVPLVVSGPGVSSTPGTGTPSVVDIPPTLLAAAGVRALDLPGVDLAKPIPASRVATAEGNLNHSPACSAVDLQHRVILEDCRGTAERMSAFDRVADPMEWRPLELSPSTPLLEAARAIRAPEARAETLQTADALRALGYAD